MDWKKSHDQTYWLFPSIFQFYLHNVVVLQEKTELSSICIWVYLGVLSKYCFSLNKNDRVIDHVQLSSKTKVLIQPVLTGAISDGLAFSVLNLAISFI